MRSSVSPDGGPSPLATLVSPNISTITLPKDELVLKRHLGLFSGVCFIIGIIIGK